MLKRPYIFQLHIQVSDVATFTLLKDDTNDDIKVVYFNFGTIDLNMGIHQANTQKRITVVIRLIKKGIYTGL